MHMCTPPSFARHIRKSNMAYWHRKISIIVSLKYFSRSLEPVRCGVSAVRQFILPINLITLCASRNGGIWKLHSDCNAGCVHLTEPRCEYLRRYETSVTRRNRSIGKTGAVDETVCRRELHKEDRIRVVFDEQPTSYLSKKFGMSNFSLSRNIHHPNTWIDKYLPEKN